MLILIPRGAQQRTPSFARAIILNSSAIAERVHYLSSRCILVTVHGQLNPLTDFASFLARQFEKYCYHLHLWEERKMADIRFLITTPETEDAYCKRRLIHTECLQWNHVLILIVDSKANEFYELVDPPELQVGLELETTIALTSSFVCFEEIKLGLLESFMDGLLCGLKSSNILLTGDGSARDGGVYCSGVREQRVGGGGGDGGAGDGDPGPQHCRPAPLREDFGEEASGGGRTEERDVAPLPDLLPLSGGPARRPAWGAAAPAPVPPLLGPHRPPLPRPPRFLRRRRPNSPLNQQVQVPAPLPQAHPRPRHRPPQDPQDALLFRCRRRAAAGAADGLRDPLPGATGELSGQVQAQLGHVFRLPHLHLRLHGLRLRLPLLLLILLPRPPFNFLPSLGTWQPMAEG
ncbi:hypothetical protein Cni_G07585 [Canna indica]|uniref:Uncharacterized protein n=1 Tax=Canna indica TaxID=4628 RepID=A0AAQ3Q5W2_9LILI|nr:hypothetical protein Cni_G07585 [Canna indica]